MEMITVPAGEVTVSDRRTQRSWTVDVASFRLAPIPVTRELYASVSGETARHPAVDVSWLDAVRFCNTLSEREGLTPAYEVRDEVVWDPSANGFRLPSEAEWEHACRAGTTGPRYGPLDEIAWYRENSAESAHDVGEKTANGWGFQDMLGNVWEWCWDVYDAEVYGEYRVLRGGGWFDEHWSCRASVRRRSHPTFRVDDVGFRLARAL
ncbi:formylglycine-generating enzyme family protein [Amycolatopsis sp. lyj-112]|uniref:formylglycine-generating enzyme family protein n=1 Tax=Amycolatopsis sp. lyj-112 TaxID=2789288 RepID=UPI00397D1163